MPKKGEHIYKRKDGRWEGRYRDGTYRNGKAIYRSIYGQNYYEVKKRLAIDNRHYFNGDVEVELTIIEANFYSEDIDIHVSKDGVDYAYSC